MRQKLEKSLPTASLANSRNLADAAAGIRPPLISTEGAISHPSAYTVILS